MAEQQCREEGSGALTPCVYLQGPFQHPARVDDPPLPPCKCLQRATLFVLYTSLHYTHGGVAGY